MLLDSGSGKMAQENGTHIVEKQLPKLTDVINVVLSQLQLSQSKIKRKKKELVFFLGNKDIFLYQTVFFPLFFLYRLLDVCLFCLVTE